MAYKIIWNSEIAGKVFARSICRKRFLPFLLTAIVLVGLFSGCDMQTSGKPLIGIAWRGDTESQSYLNTVYAIESAGGIPVLLDQVICRDLTYNEKKVLQGAADAVGALSETSAQLLRDGTWKDSNAEKVMRNISAVVFSGGEDICPSLYGEPWHGIFEEINYNPTRDVSDYLLMTYCMDQDIPVLGICRGMQMMAVAGGAGLIQDIPSYFASKGIHYDHLHRYLPGTPEPERSYVAHEVTVVEGSLAHEILGAKQLTGCPSLHHQAAVDVEMAGFVVSGYTQTCGEPLAEIIEHGERRFFVGLQFHPEAAAGRNAEMSDVFFERETALAFFMALVNAAGNQG